MAPASKMAGAIHCFRGIVKFPLKWCAANVPSVVVIAYKFYFKRD